MYKLRHWLLLLFLVAVPFTVSSQNLVRNGSFEQDDYWDDFLDTFSVPSSNIRNYFEFYIKTLRNVSDWTDSASTWTVEITNNNMIAYFYDTLKSLKYRPKQWGPVDSMYLYKELLLHPWFIDDRVFTDNFRDSVFHKTPITHGFADDYTKEVLPYYPKKALHGHKYIYLATALNEIDGVSVNDDNCIMDVSNYNGYSYMILEPLPCPTCPLPPRSYIPSLSLTNDIISNKLISPTKKGKKYKIGFFASVANNYVDAAMIDSLNAKPIKIEAERHGDRALMEIWTLPYLYFRKRQGNYRTYASDALGVLLTKREPVAFIPGEGEFYADSTNIPSDRISLESTSQQFRIPKPLMNHAEWEEFSWEFTADDEYTYLNIGNFWKRSQLNFIRWKFHLLDPYYCSVIDYVYHDIGYFIDSVYLIPLGPKIAPYQKNACIGDTVHIQDINKKEVTWFLEDGSSSLSDLLSIVISKPVTRIIAEAVGEYDTMYIYAKSIPQYELLHTDSLCVPAGQPFNKLLAIANEPQVHFSWNQNGKVQDSSLFVSADTGQAQLKLTDSIGCKYVFHIPLEEYCPCVILPSDTIICKGASLNISDYYGRAIDWAIDGVNQGNSISLTVKPNKWQTTITGSCDGLSQSMQLYIKEPPQAILTHTDSMCIWTGKLYNKLNLSSEESISGVWEFNGAIYTGLHFESMDTGIVYYKALDSLGCETHGATYLGEYCPEFSDICAFPSAFSPNGDGLNDVLTIDCINIKSFKATILDRWGEVIGMSSDANYVWDGTYKGQEATAGVYVFLIEYEVYLEPGKKYYYKGTLTLVR